MNSLVEAQRAAAWQGAQGGILNQRRSPAHGAELLAEAKERLRHVEAELARIEALRNEATMLRSMIAAVEPAPPDQTP
jgi:hypothetical protein